MDNIKYTIGYLDEEESWKATVRHKLRDQFNVILIKLEADITNIWKQILECNIDLLVVDFRLNDSGEVTYNGNDVVAEIRKHNNHFPIFIITSHESDAIEQCEDIFPIRGKDLFDEEVSGDDLTHFKESITSVIKKYRAKEADAQQTIVELNEKLYKEGTLSEADEETRFHAELYLQGINKDDNIHSRMLKKSYSSQLDQMIETAKAIAEALKK